MKREGYLKYDAVVTLGKRPLTIWGYTKKKKFACRLEVNATGIAVFSGKRGGKRLVNLTWEGFVERLRI